MLVYFITDTIFSFLVIGMLAYMYFKLIKLKNVYKDLDTIFNQISEIILHLNKSDKALSGLAASLDKIVEVVTSLLPKETKATKEPEVRAPVKRSRKKVTE